MSRPRNQLYRSDRVFSHETLEPRRMLSAATQGVVAATQPSQGLAVTYYNNLDFTGRSVTRIDPTINFNWGNGSPDPSIQPDTFAARWTGRITPRFSDLYTFHTITDDGVRLWIDGKLIIDQWKDHPNAAEHSGTITLQAGQSYDLRFEYYDNTGTARANLLWSSGQQVREIVPATALTPVGTDQLRSLSSNPTTQSSTQPAVVPDVTVHSWFDSRQDRITPMVWAYDTAAPGAEAIRVAAQLSKRSPGDRTLILIVKQPLRTGSLVEFVRNGPGIDPAWYRTFFKGLADRGVTIDRIVLDYEDDVSYWGLKSEDFLAVYDDPAAVAKLPSALRNMPRDSVVWGKPGYRDFINLWNDWAGQQRAAALRAAVSDSANQAFGTAITISNYGDLQPIDNAADRAAVVDRNGWPMPTGAVSTESSPSLYLWTGQRQWDWDYANGTGWTVWRYEKHPLWVRLVDLLNTVRVASRTGDVVPWVSSPSWAGDTEGFTLDPWLWEQLIRHCHAAGVGEFLFWNPNLKGKPAGDEAFAAQVFGSLGATQRQTDLPIIEITADEIVTVNRATGERIVTRYADFLALQPQW